MKRACIEDEDGIRQSPSNSLSNAFQLQCEDAERDRHAPCEVVAKWKKVARTVADALKTAKLKHSCEYKDLEYWSKFGITHPLVEHANAVSLTTSSVPTYKWAPPQDVKVFEDSVIHLLSANYFVVDVYVTLPDSLFGKRDYVNLIYPANVHTTFAVL